jgi:hypothetical protein
MLLRFLFLNVDCELAVQHFLPETIKGKGQLREPDDHQHLYEADSHNFEQVILPVKGFFHTFVCFVGHKKSAK